MEEKIKQVNPTLHRYLFTVTTFSKLLAMFFFILFPFVGFYLGMKYEANLTPGQTYDNSNNQTVCPQDAKKCPNGSYVGRFGPKCEFAKCVNVTSTPTLVLMPTLSNQELNDMKDWKTYYSNFNNGNYSINYPNNWYKGGEQGEGNIGGGYDDIGFSNCPSPTNNINTPANTQKDDCILLSVDSGFPASGNNPFYTFIQSLPIGTEQVYSDGFYYTRRADFEINGITYIMYNEAYGRALSSDNFFKIAGITKKDKNFYTIGLTAYSQKLLDVNLTTYSQILTSFKFTN